MKNSRISLLSAVASLLLCTPALAGWVVTMRDGSTQSFAGGKLKTVEKGNTSVFDADRGLFTMVLPQSKSYAQGTADDLCREVNTMTAAIREAMGRPAPGAGAAPRVRIVKEGRATIAGFATTRYAVSVNGAPYEELWISTAPELIEDFGPAATAKLMDAIGCLKMANVAMPATPDRDPAYRKLVGSGWVLKRTSASGEEADGETDAVKVEKIALPASAFAPPQGYRKTTFRELFGGM